MFKTLMASVMTLAVALSASAEQPVRIPTMASGSAELRVTVDRLLNRIVMLEAILTDKENEIRHLRSKPRPMDL